MPTQETRTVDSLIASRRTLLSGAGALFAGMALAPAASVAQTTTLTDNDYLNFALNLEYLEAQYYTLAALGVTIDVATGPTNPINSNTGTAAGTVTVKQNPKVAFADTRIQAYATQIAKDERRHVNFLRNVLGVDAVAMPNIDLLNSFNTLAVYAGLGAGFDPFANDVNFLLGAFIFEDVGVTAYKGALPSLTLSYNTNQTAGILSTEAYHAGIVRTLLFGLDAANPTAGIAASATKIANARAKLDGTATGTPDEVGLGVVNVALNGTAAIYPASTTAPGDANTIAFSRTATQVLSVVYAGSGKGGFFPSGLNGNVK